jgi:peptide/nickel transport system ATP-binding protein
MTLMTLDDVSVIHRVRGSGLFGRASVHALSEVTLAVRAGETVGIVGESGCGKTTLARVLVGLQRPTSGTVSYQGESLWAMTSHDRRFKLGAEVGVVFQDPATALNRRLTVRRIIADPLVVHSRGDRAAREQRVRELMDLVGLPLGLADAVPGQLSGGQRQRVAIARALALAPRLLVADEPTSALDVSVRAQILNLLNRLQAELGLAMVYVSHDIQTVTRMSHRVVTMYLGRIVEQTPSQAVEEVARHPYTHALFSATPRLLGGAGSAPVPLGGRVPSAVDPPSGCNFRTRCPRATPECALALPPLVIEQSRYGAVEYRCLHPVAGPPDE